MAPATGNITVETKRRNEMMKYNANNSIDKRSTTNIKRVNVGNPAHTEKSNIVKAKKTVRLGEIAVLPTGREWLRIRGGWQVIQ